MIGLGCASGVRYKNVKDALAIGYRLLDTAQAHEWGYTEEDVGRAVKDSGVPRNDIWIQTKIHPKDLGYARTLEVIEDSYERMKTDYVDSVLIHFPTCHTCQPDEQPSGTWKDTWRAFEELYKNKKVKKAIGVSNFRVNLMRELLEVAEITPHLVQNWMDPYHQDKEVREFCKEHGILYQAYSSLGSQWKHKYDYTGHPLFNDPIIGLIAKKHRVSPAQVILRWQHQLDVAVVPASRKPEHRQENLEIFDFTLDRRDMEQMAGLDGKKPGKRKDDGTQARVTFQNVSQKEAHVYWVKPDDNSEVLVADLEPDGDTITINSYKGHNFLARDDKSKKLGHYRVTVGRSQQQTFVISENKREL